MNVEQSAPDPPSPDPEAWVDRHGDYLRRFAIFRLLDEAYLHRLDKFLSEFIWMAKVLRHGRENISLE